MTMIRREFTFITLYQFKTTEKKRNNYSVNGQVRWLHSFEALPAGEEAEDELDEEEDDEDEDDEDEEEADEEDEEDLDDFVDDLDRLLLTGVGFLSTSVDCLVLTVFSGVLLLRLEVARSRDLDVFVLGRESSRLRFLSSTLRERLFSRRRSGLRE